MRTSFTGSFLLFCFLLTLSALGQNQEGSHSVYLIGNTATAEIPAQHLQQFQAVLASHQGAFTVLHLGDIISNEGLSDEPTEAEKAKLKSILDLVVSRPGARLYFVPGDKDWGNSRRSGLKKVKRLQELINQQQPGAFLAENGCPGPFTLDVSKTLRLVVLNSPWWTHPYDKPEAPDTECKLLSPKEISESLEEELEEADNRNVLVVGHYPVISYGSYGGHMGVRKHLFPFSDNNPGNRVPLPGLGSLYAAYRQNVGTPRDQAYPGYQQYIRQVLPILQAHPGVVYASAHDYSLQLSQLSDFNRKMLPNYQIVSGSFSERERVAGGPKELMFGSGSKGFTRLDYLADGKVEVHFFAFNFGEIREIYTNTLFSAPCGPEAGQGAPANVSYSPCLNETVAPTPTTPDQAAPRGTKQAVAGPQYKAGALKKLYFGKLYRTSWTQPIQAPIMPMDTLKGGLTIIGRGGGRQTTSLKMRGARGEDYVFRSVDKDAVNALPPELRNTFVRDIVREVTPTAQPYGSLVARSLLDSTDILHAHPNLYVLPDDPALGPFRKDFAGMLGTLEERPIDPDSGMTGFGNAEGITRSFGLYRQLFKDNHNRVDARAFAKARLFDMFVGDWGRHEDNWKWAAYKNDKGKGKVYRPIPRDRDHVFSRWNGLLPWLADREWGVPGVENFDDDFHDMSSLNWPARHLDRLLLTSLTREDWQQLARELQAQMDDATIDKAIAELPAEVQPIIGKEIIRKLKSRIRKLPKAVDEYYELLTRYVDVVGSNKGEYYQVERQLNGNVRVRMFDQAKDSDQPTGEPVFDRTFVRGETKAIHLYALGGKDVVNITGTSRHGIIIRVIGGAGQDQVKDESKVHGLKHYTKVYDNKNTDLKLGTESHNLTADNRTINRYNRESFEYNNYTPEFSVIYNQSDGLGVAAGATFRRQGFRVDGYKSSFGLSGRITQNGTRQLVATSLVRQIAGRWDLGGALSYGQYFPFYNFFGLGNSSVKDNNTFNNNRSYYLARYQGYRAEAYLQRVFWTKSYFRIGPRYEDYQSDVRPESVLGQQAAEGILNVKPQHLAGLGAEFDFDLRDKEFFTRKGLRFYAQHHSYYKTDGALDKRFGITQGFAEYFGTVRLGLPITLAVKLGGAKNYGNNLPFYKYTTLGLRENLRGYVRNRFMGDESAYLNTELRLHLGLVRSSFLPFSYGLLGFYDRGRVWFRNESPGGWHEGYGGGFYLAPVAERFTLTTTFQHSREENLLIQFGAGFRLDL